MGNKKAVLDTNILLMLCRNKTLIDEWLLSKGILYGYITSPTYFEFLGGAKSNQKRWAEKFLRNFPVIHFSDNSNIAGKSLCTKHEIAKGKQMDMLIASICIAHQLPLVTANVSDFAFNSLTVIDNNFNQKS